MLVSKADRGCLSCEILVCHTHNRILLVHDKRYTRLCCRTAYGYTDVASEGYHYIGMQLVKPGFCCSRALLHKVQGLENGTRVIAIKARCFEGSEGNASLLNETRFNAVWRASITNVNTTFLQHLGKRKRWVNVSCGPPA